MLETILLAAFGAVLPYHAERDEVAYDYSQLWHTSRCERGDAFYGYICRDHDRKVIAYDFAAAHHRAQPQALWPERETGWWWAMHPGAITGHLVPVRYRPL